MFKGLLYILLAGQIALGANLHQYKGFDGVVPPKKTTSQRDALTGLVTGQIIYNTDTKRLNQYNGSAWVDVGSGEGGINHVSPNGDAEGGTSGWLMFKDAASATGPADGYESPITASSTWTSSSSSPLRGTKSFLFTKGAANRQGEGVSYAFTVPTSDFAKVHTISFTYSTTANYVNQDVQVWIYDVTSSTLIQPSNYKLDGAPSTGPPQKYQATFQTSAASTSYRLILYVAGTTSTAWDLKVDDVTVGPQALAYASPVTEWFDYTPTVSNAGTVTVNMAQWRRVGSSMEIRAKITAGTVTGSVLKVSLPTGYSGNVSTSVVLDGAFGTEYPSGNNEGTVPIMLSAEPTVLQFGRNGLASVLTPINANTQLSNNQFFTFTASVPIVGWGSSLQISDQADGRIAVARAVLTTSQTGVASKVIPFNSVTFDTHGAMSTSGRFTCPLSGYYRVTARILVGSLDGATDAYLQVYKNGSSYSDQVYGSRITSGSTSQMTCSIYELIPCSDGDYLEVYVGGDASFDIDSGGTRTGWAVERLSGPSAIAAAESVSARYYAHAGSAALSGTPIVLKPNTKDWDTHGIFNTSTGAITLPASGKFRIVGHVDTDAAATGAQYVQIAVHTGSTANAGSVKCSEIRYFPSGANNTQAGVPCTVSGVQGDVFSVQVASNVGASRNVATTANYTWVEIDRVGN